jgi:cellobiose phosphorylase
MGIIVWVWAEVVGLFTTRILGVQLQAADGAIRIRPMLPAGMDRAQGEVTVRGTPLGITVTRAPAHAEPQMMINGRPAPSDSSGGIVPEHLLQGDRVSISVTVR